MIRKLALAAGFFFILCSTGIAQFYPTQFRPQVDWQQLSTPHFNILFPAGEDSVAWKTGRILEKHYTGVQQLTGGSLKNFPFILTNYNDRSNGFVTSLHFRSEIDIPPNKGKLLNPKTGGWLENVAPHELVHAMQLSHLGGFGLGQFVNIFSPDLARAMHGATPSGIREGLATFYESESVAPGGGRGNHPYFTNQFNAIFDGSGQWSMGQTVHVSDYSRPFNRIYLGGYPFTNWLQQTYGVETSRDAIDFNIRWPFLGYGFALKHATGKWPAQLYDEFAADKKRERSQRTQFQNIKPLAIAFQGSEIRRPKWLSDSTLIFHASFYNAKPGFYRYDLTDRSLRRFITTRSVTDYNYVLSDDREEIIYSYNDADLISQRAFKATLVQANLNKGSRKKLAPNRRLYAPSVSADSLLTAIQTHHTGGKIARINLTNHSVNSLAAPSDAQLTAVQVHPGKPDSLAVVMNQNGMQALWLVSVNDLENELKGKPTIAFKDGSIFDPVWHPGGNRLLFSADFSGTLQVYEFDLESGEIMQLTNARYNAFEASYNSDGNRIAFIIQQGNEQLPAVLSRGEFMDRPVSQNTSAELAPAGSDFSNAESRWSQSSYRTGAGWLKPRAILPAFEEVSGSDRFEFGVGLHSNDLLQQQSYSASVTAFEERLWYDLTYQNRQFFPGFRARAFSDPAIRRFRFVTEAEDTLAQTFLRQERSAALSVPLSFAIEQNVNFTNFFIEPEIRLSQLRYFNRDGSNPSDFSASFIGNIFTQFNYRLQQNIRDVQPNSGMIFYGELEHFFRSTDIALNTEAGEASLPFPKPTALRGGIFSYFAPLSRWNQSLRIGLEGITQSARLFGNDSIVSDGFDELPFPFSDNLLSLSTRYTIPLVYPDNGGLLLPLYLSSIYLAAFSNTVSDPVSGIFNDFRTVLGGGIRFQFRISNLSVDIGAGIGFEPSRNATNFFIGNF